METLDAGAFSEGEHATEVIDAETSVDTEGYEPEVEIDEEAAADAAPSYFDIDSYANQVVKVKVDGEEVEVPHVKLLLDQAVSRADIPIRASCLCRAAAAA